jgi:hypothetical protein
MDDIQKFERVETVCEMLNLLAVMQEMARRLASETHSDDYDDVQDLAHKLHDIRVQLEGFRRRFEA